MYYPAYKTCIDCEIEKASSEFPNDNRKAGRTRACCKDCWESRYRERRIARFKDRNEATKEKNRVACREWQRKNKHRMNEKYRELRKTPEGKLKTLKNHQSFNKKNPDYLFNRNLKVKFGITSEDYRRMEKTQKGLCAICNKPESGMARCGTKIRRLSVDHHHLSGTVRQLLCHKCNVGIGNFDGDVHLMVKAIAYLERHGLFSKEDRTQKGGENAASHSHLSSPHMQNGE